MNPEHERPISVISRHEHLLVAGVLVLASVLVLFEIGSKSLWYDEAFSANAALRPWRDLLVLLQSSEVNMALYYGLLHVWLKFGIDDGHIRLLSAVFAVGAVGATYLVGRRLMGGPIGLAAALLLAMNAFAVHYAQEARSYALLLFLATTSVGLLVRALDKPTVTRWVAFALVAAALPYTHLLGATMWAVHAVAIATYRPRPPLRLVAAAACLGTLLVVPVLVIAVANAGTGAVWIPAPTPRLIVESWVSLMGSGVPRWTIAPAGLALAIVGTVLGTMGAVTVVRRGPDRWAGLVVVAWLALPIGLTLAASVVKPLFVVRYVILVLPAIAILIAVGISRIRWPSVRAVVAVTMVALAASGLWGWYREAPKPDWRSASAWLLAQSEARDRSIFDGDWGASLAFYAHQAGLDKSLPLRLWRLSPSDPSFSTALEAVLPDLLRDGRTLWLLTTAETPPDPMADPDYASLRGEYEVVSSEDFDGVTITRLEPISS